MTTCALRSDALAVKLGGDPGSMFFGSVRN
jgi:hypothetical protein